MTDRKRWHDQWIAIEPDRFEGKPYIRGTNRTVAEVQTVWRQTGVYARQLREAFPDLTEAHLGAAVTWAPEPICIRSFIAEWEGPPRRRLELRCEQSAPENERQFRGWLFQVWEIDEAGEGRPGWDNWEESLQEILLYPQEHAPRDITWRDETSGEIVDIYGLDEP